LPKRKRIPDGMLSDEEFEKDSCERKHRFATKNAAKWARGRMKESGLRIYPCDFCGGFHIGHKTWTPHK
jgi:hypothetical protein